MKYFTISIIALIAISTIVYFTTGKLLWEFIFNGSVVGDYIIFSLGIILAAFVLFMTGRAIYNLIKEGW